MLDEKKIKPYGIAGVVEKWPFADQRKGRGLSLMLEPILAFHSSSRRKKRFWKRVSTVVAGHQCAYPARSDTRLGGTFWLWKVHFGLAAPEILRCH